MFFVVSRNPAFSLAKWLLLQHEVFVVSGNPTCSLAEWPSSSACSLVVSASCAFSFLLLYVVFVVTGNPTF